MHNAGVSTSLSLALCYSSLLLELVHLSMATASVGSRLQGIILLPHEIVAAMSEAELCALVCRGES